ncbi:MAG: HAMP domain-containing sensor histidine kinase, partial [Mycobacterium sp.]
PPPPPPPRGGPAPPVPPRPPPPPPPRYTTATVITHPLPGGGHVILVADTTSTTTLLRQLRIILIVSGVVVLAIAALGLAVVVRAAMAPLHRLTYVAGSIAAGDRGRRVHPDRPATELGRAAAAFDTMLDALEDSEKRARAAADTATQAESTTRQFLADAAHELRTPIAGIQAGAEQIASAAGQISDDPESARQQHRADLVLTEARRAGRLVGDMLDLSRIDAGLPLDLQECDLVGLAQAERDRSALLAPSVQVSCTGATAVPIRADPNRVAQILANVADNARRHTPPGGTIVIDVGCHDNMAHVTITDSGAGVPADQCARIFERLVRLDEARARDRGGAGLGLPIARALARAHGGDLVCEPYHPGARFTLRLPTGGSR